MISQREIPLDLTVSVVVPCHTVHSKYLAKLLKQIDNSSLKGVEVCVVESDQSEAVNRNRVCKKATGDIIVCQDADDFPHVLRFEIIKYFFDHYDICHLTHGITRDYINHPVPLDGFGNIRWDGIHWMVLKSAGDMFEHNFPIGNGPCAFLRKFFGLERDRLNDSKIEYDETMNLNCDTRFNQQFYELKEAKNKCITLLCDLYLYRYGLGKYWVDKKSEQQ